MQLPGQITLKSTFTQLAPATLTPQTVLARGGAAYLTHLPDPQMLYDGTVPLAQNDPERFSGAMLALYGHSWQPYTPANLGIVPELASLKF